MSISTKITGDKVNSILGFSNNKSDGYRHNTDYKKNNYFIKSVFENGDHPIELITSFTDNKFGANGFYASPSATEQYEETQSSLVGLSMSIFSEKLVLNQKFIGEEVRTNTYTSGITHRSTEIFILQTRFQLN